MMLSSRMFFSTPSKSRTFHNPQSQPPSLRGCPSHPEAGTVFVGYAMALYHGTLSILQLHVPAKERGLLDSEKVNLGFCKENPSTH